MSTELTDETLNDIFHIPTENKSHPVDSNESPSFEDKKEDLASVLGDDLPITKKLDTAVSDKKEDIKEIIEDVVQSVSENKDGIAAVLGMKEPKPETEKERDIFDDKVPVDTVSEPGKVAEEIITPPVAEQQTMLPDPIPEPIDHGLPKGEVRWLTECPSPKFESFYREKISAIRDISHGRQIEFSKLRDELRNSHTDVSCRVFDTGILFSKMSMVQLIKQRVAQIQVDVNSQYFEWERMVELMHGVLARTHYERGKQEGIQYEHMRDMEVYFAKLKSLHRIADNIQKNLDSAIDVLSRQVTIVQDKVKRKEGSAESFVETNIDVPLPHPDLTCVGKGTPVELEVYDDLAIGSRPTAESPKKTENTSSGDIIKQGWDAI